MSCENVSTPRSRVNESLPEGIIFIDLVDEFKDLPPDKLAEMFIQEEQVKDYSGTAGHYTIKGNQYVADVLYGSSKI